MNPNKLVLFDVDGTLIDSQHMIVAAMTAAFTAEGIAVPDRAAILSIIGLSLVEAMRVLGSHAAGFPAEALAERYRAAFRELRLAGEHEEPLFPGASEAIARLFARDDLLLGLATGKSMRGVRAMLAMHGLEGRFLTIQTADGNPSKPDPAMVNRAMAEVGAVPETTVVVGDTAWDIRMARAAGAAAIGVGWGYHATEELLAAGAQCVLPTFEDLDAALLPALG